MKKALNILCCLIGFFAITPARATLHSIPDSIIRPASLTPIPLSEVIYLPAKKFYTLLGRKPGLKERIVFPLVKIKMKRAVAKDSTITVEQYFASQKKAGGGSEFLLVMVILVGIVIIATLLAGGPSFNL